MHCHWSLSVVVRRPLTIYIFNFFLKTTWPIVTIFGLKHIQDKRNINCEIYDLSSPGASWAGPNMEKKNHKIFKNLLLYSYICGRKTKCMVMMSMKPSTKIVKFVAPGSGVQALGQGQYGHNSEHVLSLRKCSSLLPRE